MSILGIKLPKISIDWYPVEPEHSEQDDYYEIEFNGKSDFVIIKTSAIKKAYMHRKEVFDWCDDSTTCETSEKFNIDTNHFMEVDEQWEGYEKMAELWNKAAEQLDWSEE